MQGLPPKSDYRFKHALIQEAAYENLLRSRRTVLHRRVAEIVRVERDKFPAIAAAEPEVLAHHFTQAGLDEPAIEWWGKAGEQALHRSAYVEGRPPCNKCRPRCLSGRAPSAQYVTASRLLAQGRSILLQADERRPVEAPEVRHR